MIYTSNEIKNDTLLADGVSFEDNFGKIVRMKFTKYNARIF